MFHKIITGIIVALCLVVMAVSPQWFPLIAALDMFCLVALVYLAGKAPAPGVPEEKVSALADRVGRIELKLSSIFKR